MVQAELKRRSELGLIYSSNDIFSAKLICEDCGGFYGRKIWHSNSIYRKEIYRCNHKFDSKNHHKCQTPNLSKEEIIQKFMKAYNKIMANKEEIIEELTEVAELIGNQEVIDEKISKVKEELEVVGTMIKTLIDKRTKTSELTEEEFRRQYKIWEDTSNQLNAKINTLLYYYEQAGKTIPTIDKLYDKIDFWSSSATIFANCLSALHLAFLPIARTSFACLG